jgi:hypothetical protein
MHGLMFEGNVNCYNIKASNFNKEVLLNPSSVSQKHLHGLYTATLLAYPDLSVDALIISFSRHVLLCHDNVYQALS